MADNWFAANAPKAAASGDDFFAANAPKPSVTPGASVMRGPTLDPMMSRLFGRMVVAPPRSDDPANDEPNLVDKLVHGMSGLSNPQTAGDMAGLLIPAGEGVQIGRRVISPVTSAVSKYGGAVVDAGVGLLPKAAQKAIGVLGELKPSTWNNPLTVAGREARATASAVDHYMPNSSGASAPQVFDAELLNQRMPTTPHVPGYGPTIDPIAPVPSHAPTPSPPVAAPAAAQTEGDLLAEKLAQLRLRGRQIAPPIEPVASHAPTPAPVEPIAPVASHPLTQPRVDVGAEVVGRQSGMTKQAVRDATGPILGEEQGAASPILPEKALQRIIDTIKALPPGGPEREAYVQAATSGKAQWQIENIRRTLEHLGLIVPAATAAGLTLRGRMVPSGGPQ